MGTRPSTGEPSHSVEGIRVHEVGRLFSKLSLSPEQTEAIENLSRSLVDKLVRGPIAKTISLLKEPSELVASGETLRGRSGRRGA